MPNLYPAPEELKILAQSGALDVLSERVNKVDAIARQTDSSVIEQYIRPFEFMVASLKKMAAAGGLTYNAAAPTTENMLSGTQNLRSIWEAEKPVPLDRAYTGVQLPLGGDETVKVYTYEQIKAQVTQWMGNFEPYMRAPEARKAINDLNDILHLGLTIQSEPFIS